MSSAYQRALQDRAAALRRAQRARGAGVVRPALFIGICAVGVPAAVLGLIVAGVPAFLMVVLVMVFVMLGLVRSAPGWRKYEAYPDLGDKRVLWERAGATPAQLTALNEAHRVQQVTPPVGFSDRRTVVNPLGDAYAIYCSPAWKDPWLADRRLQIDPIAEATDIIGYLQRVTQLLHEVRHSKGTTTPGSAIFAQYVAYEQALQQALDAALRRSKALTHYRHEVVRLERLLDEERRWPEVTALGDRVLDVVSESAAHDLATGYLDSTRAQLADVENDLREITSVLGAIPIDPDTLPGLSR